MDTKSQTFSINKIKNRNKYFIGIAILSISLFSCDVVKQVASQAQAMTVPIVPTANEAAGGLKDALKQGFGNGVDLLSVKGGFMDHPLYKIPLPADAQKVADKLRSIGYGAQVDNVIAKMNEGAENAVKTAKPIFFDAVTNMSFNDAMGILTGGKSSATNYLKTSTTSALTTAFKPKIQESLDQVGATKYWGELVATYNRIPMVQKLNPDLNAFVTDKALVALFSKVADEENAIRESTSFRTTDLMKKAFAYADTKK
jgi:hypothetical protein